MDSTTFKYYHVHEFDSKCYLDAFLSPNTNKQLQEEAIWRPMKYMHKELVSGHVKGYNLIDITVGPSICHLFPVCEFFKEITILEFNRFCVAELDKWLSNDKEAFDWSHASKFMMDLEGKSGGWKEKEELLRGKIKSILKCDITKDNPTDPVELPKADCIICMWVLDVISTDKDAYISNLRKISSLLKPGGRLMLVSDINATFYIVGEHKYGVLTYDEEFLKTALKNEGYIIETYEAHDRKVCLDYIDYEKLAFLTALKPE
ncbi:nicotinamide N-methyltransferase-like [Spea bombifrons]|uniref:nicotinamide N-methyltransferase-like n=1 Tax=Spea bombifrons TaxID=233779 RepID=UPI00234AF783|nr:nicotinamide N-methyltransferase-like [Spea bombifrons]